VSEFESNSALEFSFAPSFFSIRAFFATIKLVSVILLLLMQLWSNLLWPQKLLQEQCLCLKNKKELFGNKLIVQYNEVHVIRKHFYTIDWYDVFSSTFQGFKHCKCLRPSLLAMGAKKRS